MPHILRDASGRIASVHRDPQSGSEAVPADHPELAELLGESATEAAFASLDAGLIRVLEDLVDVLVARNIICITDLPPEAQHKLFTRKNFRDRFQRNALQLWGDGPSTAFGGDTLIPTIGGDEPVPARPRRRPL